MKEGGLGLGGIFEKILRKLDNNDITVDSAAHA